MVPADRLSAVARSELVDLVREELYALMQDRDVLRDLAQELLKVKVGDIASADTIKALNDLPGYASSLRHDADANRSDTGEQA